MFRCFKSGNPELLGGAITSMSIAGPSAMLRSMHVMAQSGRHEREMCTALPLSPWKVAQCASLNRSPVIGHAGWGIHYVCGLACAQ